MLEKSGAGVPLLESFLSDLLTSKLLVLLVLLLFILSIIVFFTDETSDAVFNVVLVFDADDVI
jgi:hypothetical protein